jgi:acylphosphatase
MEKVGRVTSNFKETVEVQMRSTVSKEAGAYGVKGSCVIVDGNIRLQADFDEKKLEEAIKQRIADKTG